MQHILQTDATHDGFWKSGVKGGVRWLDLLGLLVVLNSFVPVAIGRTMQPPWGAFRVYDFSPDKSQVLMDVCDSSSACAIGAMDLRTRKLTLYSPINGSSRFSSPSPSADGTRLAVTVLGASGTAEVSQIAVIDLGNKSYRMVTSSNTYKQFPSFSEDGRKIVFARANLARRSGRVRLTDWDIYEVDLSSGSETKVTDYCFYAVSRPQYLDAYRIMFSGEPMCNFSRKTGVIEKESHDAYTAKYGENFIFALKKKEENLQPYFLNGSHSNSPLVARAAGKILFVSRTNDMDRVRGMYNYDLFLRENTTTRRLTDLKTFIRGVAISSDGSLVAYQSDETRNGMTQLWLLDANTGVHQKMGASQSNPIGTSEIVLETLREE